ncbi:SET domain-containing protein SmydA-8 isoform X2 [Andrena cerasifolii]|uniref:SET domain-containing protein SmydA-8 isoform X2 n=1 Tax=Andrena cerasifolii TaxID=2819439 RepID=UPI0040378DF9
MEPQTVCAICGEVAFHKCSACENEYYCSKQHQKADWIKHADLAENSTLGRHYIATRNIKVGEIILKEDQPLIAGPMQNSIPVCLGCYKVLNKNIAVPCRKCGWPLCQNCKDHGPECDFTSSRRDDKVTITEFGYPHPSYQCINIIKALSMKITDPESFQKLLSFESHCKRIKEKAGVVLENPLNILRFIRRFFKTDDILDEEITKIVGILQVNGHEVPLADPPYIAVYELASFLEHACNANCSKSFTNEGGIIFHAATPIVKGQHISICYTDALWSTANRRYYLSETKFFDCVCDRCKDPTEFGVMYNSIKCNEINCSGFMLPKTYLDPEQKEYVCTTCGLKLCYDKVEEILEKIGIDLSNIKKNDITACKEFLSRYKNVLHANHFYIIDVTIALSQLIGVQSGGLQAIDEDLLVEKIELCKKVSDVLKILAPAENRIRGLILFETHATLAEYSRRHTEEDTLVLLLESKKCLIEAYRLLKYEPEVLLEGKVARRAKQNLKNFNEILKRLN